MASPVAARNTRPMDYEAIFDQAVRVAYLVFPAPSDKHALGAFAALVWHTRRGEVPQTLLLH